jgi:hypothetical protein
MDSSAIAVLGQQLTDFLVSQFAPPPGSKTLLGFSGTGTAVDPNAFLNGSQFNPALVNNWLDVVADPLGEINAGSGQVGFSPWTATQLLEAIYSEAITLAAPDSDAQHMFAKVKSDAMEGLGGATTTRTAPLDWYDPASVPQWPDCRLTVASTSSSDTSTTLPAKQPAKPLWAWRKVDGIAVDAVAVKTAPAYTAYSTNKTRRYVFDASSMSAFAASHAASPVLSERVLQVGKVTDRAPVVSLAPVTSVQQISVDRVATSVISQKTVSATQALQVSQAASTAAAQASTSSVATSSLTMHAKYQLVKLSRAPWWNEFFLLLNNWYVPGLRRAELIEDNDGQSVTGVPIALILTSDVSIMASWSDADRAAATSSTHLGPWTLNSAKFVATSDAGMSALTIPGTQAIGCIYRILPALPPQGDPSLPAPAKTQPVSVTVPDSPAAVSSTPAVPEQPVAATAQ